MMPKLNLLFVHSQSIGYGRLGVNLARELRHLGIDVLDHLPEPDKAPQQHLEHLAHLNTGARGGIAPVVAWISVPTHARGWYRGQVPVIFTMWESRSLPPSFRENLHEFDTILVPSRQNQELFSEYHPNVKLVLLGVDPTVWKPTPRQAPGLFFNFLIAGSGPRKGTDLAHQAFRKLWPKEGSWPKDGPVPKLIMKNPRGEQFYGNRVEIVSGRLEEATEVALYETAHCYLQPSRGEGFGLQPLQALAQGCPTILTDAHGHASFAHLGYGISSQPAQSAYFIYGNAGEWWEPSLDDLCQRMEWVYLNYDQACADAAVSAEMIAEGWTWAHTAGDFLEAVGRERLCGEVTDLAWYEPTSQLFSTVTNRDWPCDIAGTHYQFIKGTEYWVPADVKRILWEAQLLDLSCLEGTDVGLLPEQLDRMVEYRDRHSYCALCGTKIGSGTTRADEIYAGMTNGDTG